MAKLSELSGQYREAAIRLRVAIQDRRMLAAAGDRQAASEVVLLRQMLGEMRDLRQLVGSYYTRPRSGEYTTAGLHAPRVDMTKT